MSLAPAVGHYGRARRTLNKRPDDPAALAAATDAHRNMAAAQIAAAVSKYLAAAPPLTDEQVERIADLLRGGSTEGAQR